MLKKKKASKNYIPDWVLQVFSHLLLFGRGFFPNKQLDEIGMNVHKSF